MSLIMIGIVFLIAIISLYAIFLVVCDIVTEERKKRRCLDKHEIGGKSG
ncbi:MAG: hypothetical protein KAI67_01725 [Candidatus Pacebacteria bacterium]|nr:hypothetical protein [Candidatus Paceibacterota bacterium]